MPKATTIADERLGHYDIFAGIEEEIKSLDVIKLPITPTQEDILNVVQKAKSYQQVIITTYNSNVYQDQIKLIDQVSELNKELHVISMRNPYDLYYAKDIKKLCLFI